MRRFKAILVAVALFVSAAFPHRVSAAEWDPFPWGQCTYWAASMRPDIVGRVWGNARDWAAEARWSGLPVGYTPNPGAVAVFQPWTYFSDWYGHVAYVTRVGKNGWFEVSEMNFPWLGGVDYRWVQNNGGIQFIYRQG
jgi:surface antigen